MAGYRILSLDGGGPWAILQVMALINIYSAKGDGSDVTGHQVLRKFDLIAANSGGTLTLGGLIMDWSLDRIRNIFLDPDQRALVFVPASFFDDPFAHITQLVDFGPKYSAAGKFNGLRTILGARGDAYVTDIPDLVGAGYGGRKPHFLICAFDYDSNRETFFRSDTKSRAASMAAPAKVTLAQAIHASANPPVNYFDAPAELPQHTRFWDGAVGGYNNPVLAAVIEAIANAPLYNTDRSSIQALSIGTANVALPAKLGHPKEDPDLVAQHQSSTIVADVKKLATAILDDPPDAATFHAHVMLGGALPSTAENLPFTSPVIRMNALIQPVPGTDRPWELPQGLDRKAFKSIYNMPMDAPGPDDVKTIRAFGELWLADAVPNQPVRANRDTLVAEIGYGRFRAAREAAREIFK